MARNAVDPKITEMVVWYELLTSKPFSLLTKHLHSQIKRYEDNIDRLDRDPTLDNSVKLATLLAKKQELVALVRFFEVKKENKLKYDKTKSTAK